MKIKFCSAPPGSGKTHQISNRSCNLAGDFNKVLILQPTRDLLGNTAAKEIRPFRCQIFHKGTVEGSVAKALADYVAEVPDDI
jgi:reverse gyrase